MDDVKDKSDRVERTRNGTFEQEGYNTAIDMPLDVEPLPKDAPGAAIDVRDMPQDGVVVIHDDDDEILDADRDVPPQAPA